MKYFYRNRLPTVEMALGETLDWSRSYKLDDGDAIATSVWSVPTGLTAGAASVSGSFTKQWVSADLVGLYGLVNTVTTSAGRKFVRTLMIDVVDRL